MAHGLTLAALEGLSYSVQNGGKNRYQEASPNEPEDFHGFNCRVNLRHCQPQGWSVESDPQQSSVTVRKSLA